MTSPDSQPTSADENREESYQTPDPVEVSRDSMVNDGHGEFVEDSPRGAFDPTTYRDSAGDGDSAGHRDSAGDRDSAGHRDSDGDRDTADEGDAAAG